ncbi:MAG: hypothetical protein U0X39_15905 [Bacteroidales bacterium]
MTDKMRLPSIIIVLLVLTSGRLASQESKIFTVNGYLTTMQSATFDSLKGEIIYDNLIHNRVNMKLFPSKNITIAAEFRNRLFTGDMVKTGNAYAEMIGYDQGWADLSWNLASERSFLLNTTIDRLWIDYTSGKFQVTLGRQRINWGQTFVWNPNDIFNAYSFFDFDYVERPGSDAVRIQYFPNSSSTIDLALKADNFGNITAAGLYRFNKWGYDIQFLAGLVSGNDIVLGTGWSGSIGSLSFRGEVSFFDQYEDFPGDEGALVATTGLEKVFSDNSMAQVQLMYSTDPMKLTGFSSFYSGTMSARNLAFSHFTAFGQYTWAITPLSNLGLSAMWFPDLKGYFAGPSFDYSVAENLDFSLIWQHFTSTVADTRTRVNMAFLRIKYSF